MKHCLKFTVLGIAFSIASALGPSNAFAQCYDASLCAQLIGDETSAQWWMEENETLGPDEEYVAGYENMGPAECWVLGSPLGPGYEPTALPAGCDGLSPLYETRGKRLQKKKQKKEGCIPATGTGEYGLIFPLRPGDYEDRKVGNGGGCGWEWKRLLPGLPFYYPEDERCGPTSASPDCQ